MVQAFFVDSFYATGSEVVHPIFDSSDFLIQQFLTLNYSIVKVFRTHSVHLLLPAKLLVLSSNITQHTLIQIYFGLRLENVDLAEKKGFLSRFGSPFRYRFVLCYFP